MVDQKYSDGVNDISIINGNVRVDWASFIPGEVVDPNDPPAAVTMRLVLSPKGFLSAYHAFERMVAEMETRGVITRNAAALNKNEELIVTEPEPEPA